MKRILINFDGTGNEPGDAEQQKEEGIIQDNSISNVMKIHLLAGGNIENTASSFKDQVPLYYPGVGVRGNFFKRLWRMAFAAKAPEVIMREALEDLEQIYEKTDRLYIFGFSRGAAIARLFASKLAKNGIQTASGELDKHPVVEFIGVFDTVAAFGKPNLNSSRRPISDVVFENGTISPIIRHAYHLVSLDENRLAFRPTLMNCQDNVHEVWFPGVHSDVGGGYYQDALSDIALEYMLKRAEDHGLRFHTIEEIPKQNLTGKDHNDEAVIIGIDDLEIKPDICGKIHYHDEPWRDYLNVLGPRLADVLKNDVPCDLPITIHKSIIERMNMKELKYDPISLMDEAYKIVE